VSHAALVPALSLVAGVAVGLWVGGGGPAWYVVLLSALVTSAWAYRRHQPVVVLAAVSAGWAAGGALLALHADGVARDPPIRGLIGSGDEPVVIEGRLGEDAARTATGVSLVIDIERLGDGPERSIAVQGRALVSIGGDPETAPVHEWRAGRRVRVPAWLRAPTHYRNPGGPDHRLALARRGVVLVGSVKSAALLEVTAPGGAVDELCAAVRAAVRRHVASSVQPWAGQSAAITTAILIGDRVGLDDRVTRALQQAGTYHVIAISGGNVAILAGCLLLIGRAVRLPWRLSLALAAVTLIGYAHVASGGSSVARATTMAVVYLVARALDHQGSGASSIAVAATLILCVAPLSVVDPGFLLTFGATTAMLVLVPPIAGAVRPAWLRAPAALLAASVASELALMPVGALYFSRITVAGLLLNFAAVPLMTIVQIGAMVALATSALAPSAGVAAGWVPHAAAEALVSSAAFVDWAPWTTWRVAPPPPWALVAYYGGLVLAVTVTLHGARWPLRLRRLAGGAAGVVLVPAAVCILAAPAYGAPGSRHPVRLVALDVGQGDATLVELPSRRALLVDAGGLGGQARFDIGERVVAPALWARGIRSLDALVLTHGDADHVGGAAAVLELFRTREVWEGVAVPTHEPLVRVAAAADRAAVPWRTVQDGDRLRAGQVTIDVLHPPPAEWERQRIRNNDSVVLEVRIGDVSIVLPGDAGAEVEAAVAARLSPARLRVLKAGHHGSRSSSSAAFVRAVRPAIAVISCGQQNRFGHPAREVLARLEAAGAHIFRTDEDGAVTIETDGREVVVHTWSGRHLVFTPDGVHNLAAPAPRRSLRESVERWLRVTQGVGAMGQ
jgi:competence protein ComEC